MKAVINIQMDNKAFRATPHLHGIGKILCRLADTVGREAIVKWGMNAPKKTQTAITLPNLKSWRTKNDS